MEGDRMNTQRNPLPSRGSAGSEPAVDIATCDTCTLEDIALVRVTGYTLDEIEVARARLQRLNDLDAREAKAGTR